MLTIKDPIQHVPLIGPKYEELLAKLEIHTVEDLITYFPVRYKDTSRISLISDLDTLHAKTVRVNVETIRSFRTKYGKYITQATVYDTSGMIEATWFNQPFLTKNIQSGSTILLNGKLSPKRNKPQLYSPTYELVRDTVSKHLGRIVPIYKLTQGITNKWLRARIANLLENHQYLLERFNDAIPQEIVERYDLLDKKSALEQVHFPQSRLLRKRARERLAFEELYEIQLLLVKKIDGRKKEKGPDIAVKQDQIDAFFASLPFTPTAAQRRVTYEILEDFKNKWPANRLLQGDVGSGKTLVAAALAIATVDSGYQIAVLAPTAILAKQHFQSFQVFLKSYGYEIQLITGSTEKAGENGLALQLQKANIVIGTHALLHRHADLFDNLGLLIVDEQHRFGVKQRRLLAQVGAKNHDRPHTITMTATPIPRSIALTLFGDLEISILDEMPAGRIPTKTYLVPQDKRADSYQWIEKMIIGGQTKGSRPTQVFWLCPLIEESDKLQTKAVITQYELLENEIFPNLSIDLLHGRLSDEEKDAKINRMHELKTDVLVTTSVIEVGMDIPFANIIVIEGAERFGLAQLHQLRGRVGRRAKHESWCFLFTSENASPEAKDRLQYFAGEDSGLKVAQYDLKRRGPGEVYGTKQAGIPNLKIASLGDTDLIKQTREAAEKTLL